MYTFLLPQATIVFKLSVIMLVVQLSSQQTAKAVEISLNKSENLSLIGNIVYGSQNSSSTISFQIDAPIVCTSINISNNPFIVLDAYDANNLALATMDHSIISSVYDLANERINIQTDDSIQCATQHGLLVQADLLFNNGFEAEISSDLIFINGFEVEATHRDLQLRLYNDNGQPFPIDQTFSDQQIINYQYVISNNGNVPLVADLGEYYKLDGVNPYFSGVAGSDWQCNTSDTAIGSSTTCGDFIVGEGLVRLKNARVEPSEQLIINVARKVEIPNGSTINTIQLLAATFVTDNSDFVIDNNTIFQIFTFEF